MCVGLGIKTRLESVLITSHEMNNEHVLTVSLSLAMINFI